MIQSPSDFAEAVSDKCAWDEDYAGKRLDGAENPSFRERRGLEPVSISLGERR
jgi:hypothetical protein